LIIKKKHTIDTFKFGGNWRNEAKNKR
jgi:hypothetical protein